MDEAKGFHRAMVASPPVPIPGEQTRAAVYAQPEWLAAVAERVGDRRFPSGRLLFTGCGTSFHAAQAAADLAGGEARQALELVLRSEPADLLVAISHEGTTALTTEAVRAFPGETWLVTGAPESPLASLVDEVLQVAPEIEESYCHTKSYTVALAGCAVMAGHEVSGVEGAVRAALEADEGPEPSDHDRWLVIGAGRDWPTAQEAALKLREGTFVAAEAYPTEQLLHGHLAAIDETVRAIVLEGEGRARERSHDVMRALGEIGCATELLSQAKGWERPILGILPFHLLVLALAERRDVNPDRIRLDEERWDRARQSYA
jgi:glucosamine--fructose-6-phosphate aminotransferase (isomerizing)